MVNNDISLALECGIDIPFPQGQLIIHQPTMEEIAYVGEKNFLIGIQCLCIDKNQQEIQDKSLLDNISNFQIFMRLMQDPEAKDKKDIIIDVFSLIFPLKQIAFLPRSILFQEQGMEPLMIDENNFEDLQELIKIVFCMDKTSNDFHPKGDKAQEIANKLKRARERVAAQRSGESSTNVFSQYLSVLSIALHLSLNECKKYTMYQLFDFIERYTLYTSWDMNIRSRMAGAKIDKQPENWMKPIH